MVLMALVDADYKFLYVNVGANGSASDSTVLENTSFWRALEQNKLHLPPAEDKHGYNQNKQKIFGNVKSATKFPL